jgi:translocator protein
MAGHWVLVPGIGVRIPVPEHYKNHLHMPCGNGGGGGIIEGMRMSKKDWPKLIIALALPFLAGWIGSIATMPTIPGWYASLDKPALNPPSWIFGPVWTTLYVLMGIAAFLVWRKGWENRKVKLALSVFGLQLLLNSAWSVLFFGLKNPGGAFVDIIFMWVAIAATIVLFGKISKTAAWLLVPYILWVSFAAYLNYSIWMLQG